MLPVKSQMSHVEKYKNQRIQSMPEIKTKQHDGDVRAFLDTIENEARRREAHQLCDLFEKETGRPARMWGPAIVDFGDYRYTLANGKGNDFFVAGFSPRKANFSLYFVVKPADYAELLPKLGKYKTAKSCVYLNKMTDVNCDALAQLIRESMAAVKNT